MLCIAEEQLAAEEFLRGLNGSYPYKEQPFPMETGDSHVGVCAWLTNLPIMLSDLLIMQPVCKLHAQHMASALTRLSAMVAQYL